jgi:type I restriction enzyme M protein
MATPKATKSTDKSKGFEETLWDAANKLRGSVESAEYKHIVLSLIFLIFLKFISDKFETQRSKLMDNGMGDYVDMVEFYAKENVFYLPKLISGEVILKEASHG